MCWHTSKISRFRWISGGRISRLRERISKYRGRGGATTAVEIKLQTFAENVIRIYFLQIKLRSKPIWNPSLLSLLSLFKQDSILLCFSSNQTFIFLRHLSHPSFPAIFLRHLSRHLSCHFSPVYNYSLLFFVHSIFILKGLNTEWLVNL